MGGWAMGTPCSTKAGWMVVNTWSVLMTGRSGWAVGQAVWVVSVMTLFRGRRGHGPARRLFEVVVESLTLCG